MAIHNLPPARLKSYHDDEDSDQNVVIAALDATGSGVSEALAFTVGSNVTTAVIVGTCRYQRIDDVVTVSGSVTVDLDSTGASVFLIAFPTLADIANVAAAAEVSGVYIDADGDIGVIVGDVTNDAAEVTFSATAATARIGHFWFSYVAD
jgi:hypothetical protein